MFLQIFIVFISIFVVNVFVYINAMKREILHRRALNVLKPIPTPLSAFDSLPVSVADVDAPISANRRFP